MRSIIRFLIVAMVPMALLSCNKTLKTEQLPANIQIGASYYSQVTLQYEKGRHITTNYRRGVLLPINSKVRLLEINKKTILLQVEQSNHELLIKNALKHTGNDTIQAFNKLFGKNKVDLSGFSKMERENIKFGKVAKGMSKKAVIVAIGYPPQIQTPSLDVNQWTYWSSRWDRFIVHFDNGRVLKIQE